MMRVRFGFTVSLILILSIVCLAQGTKNAGGQDWQNSFPADKSNLADTGRNPYYVLEPGYRLTFEHGKDTLVVTVLEETRVVDGVRTRVVEERETSGGQLAEVSRNYFVIDKTTHNLYYFGEDVDEYKNGKVTGHEGSWLSGISGARFGLMLPGNPRPGDRYYQELAPKVAMDRAQVISITETLKVPAGAYAKVLHTRESSALESGSEDKWYAPEVGLIKDADFVLAKVETGKK